MKQRMHLVLIFIVICALILFIHFYVGTDEATSVPKALLMRIHPLPWEEIYWDEQNQILKLTVMEETVTGEKSRCLRIFTLMPSGLIMGGREFSVVDSLGITNAFVNCVLEDGHIKLFDQRSSGELFSIRISDICNSEEIKGIYPGKVYYELGEEVIMHVVLGYKTTSSDEIVFHDSIPEITALINYDHDIPSGMESFEIDRFSVLE